METEIEAKFCDINADEVRKKLASLNAKLVHEEILMKREAFDFPDDRLEKVGGWARVRDEGDKVTLGYKQLNDRGLHGTKEVSLQVNDFKLASEFLKCLGLEVKSYQETKREKWLCHQCEVTIDTWPWIPTFLEIEGPTEDNVRKVAADLGFAWNDAMHGSVETVYQMHYDVTEHEVDNWPEIKFVDAPKELTLKSKNNKDPLCQHSQ